MWASMPDAVNGVTTESHIETPQVEQVGRSTEDDKCAVVGIVIDMGTPGLGGELTYLSAGGGVGVPKSTKTPTITRSGCLAHGKKGSDADLLAELL